EWRDNEIGPPPRSGIRWSQFTRDKEVAHTESARCKSGRGIARRRHPPHGSRSGHGPVGSHFEPVEVFIARQAVNEATNPRTTNSRRVMHVPALVLVLREYP